MKLRTKKIIANVCVQIVLLGQTTLYGVSLIMVLVGYGPKDAGLDFTLLLLSFFAVNAAAFLASLFSEQEGG